MAGPIAIDTPDYQRGVASPQVLLATVPAGTDSVTVGVPSNAEAIVVTAPNNGPNQNISCQGVTTGILYPGVFFAQAPGTLGDGFMVFDVTSVLDAQVTIQVLGVVAFQWYVYADVGVRVVADASKFTNGQGIQYVTPSIPDTAPGDHPPNELLVVDGNAATPYTLIVPPALGSRLRLFALAMEDNGTSAASYITNKSTGTIYLPCAAPGNNSVQIPLTGLALPEAEGVNVVSSTAGRLVAASAYYTIEQI